MRRSLKNGYVQDKKEGLVMTCGKEEGRRRVDLHVHSNHSDGLLKVEDVVRRAREAEVDLLSITDHDTLAGVMDGMRFAREAGMEFVSGVEISCGYKGIEVHILGYGILIREAAKLEKVLERNRQAREHRIQVILANCCEAGILDMEYGELCVLAERFGRKPSCMDVLLARMEKGKVPFAKAWEEIMRPDVLAGDGSYREMLLSPNEAVKAIVRSGGVAILAHPGETYERLGKNEEEMGKLMETLVLDRLDGLEIHHLANEKIKDFAPMLAQWQREYCLRVSSAGSDNHGIADYRAKIGRYTMNEDELEVFNQMVEMRRRPHLSQICQEGEVWK